MSKDFKKQNGKQATVVKVTNSLNKHGVIKGKDKKETKMLKWQCPHHKLTKKGKLKSMIYNDGNGVCSCSMCGHKFPPRIANKTEIAKVVNKTIQYVDQARYMVTAADLGQESETYLERLSVDINRFPKVYGRIGHVINKHDNTKKKKNKNRNRYNDSGSSSYGGWS